MFNARTLDDATVAALAERVDNAARDRHMIVLDHRGIPQAHAVVRCPTHARGIFFKHAKPGNGFARVQQGAARA